MKFVGIRDLRNKSSQIMKSLPYEKEVVITSNGKPTAIIAPVSEDNLEEFLAAFRKARSINTVAVIQEEAFKKNLDKLTLKEINYEIQSVRKKRRK